MDATTPLIIGELGAQARANARRVLDAAARRLVS